MASVRIITAIPSAMPIMAIFITGLENPLWLENIFFDMKYSKFIATRKYTLHSTLRAGGNRYLPNRQIRLLFIFLSFMAMNHNLFCQYRTIQLLDKTSNDVRVGAERIEDYLPLLKEKKVALVAHPASVVKGTHLVDTLLKLKINLKKIFAPEHGFRGEAEAGGKISDGVDAKTKLPVISLYGKNNKPKPSDLAGVEVVLFDLQDVGARFYTYLSTLHYVMEACAENNTLLVLLDRPNPNGYYVDGPILDSSNQSFVGMHPVPIVHGMTLGEYAQMINGEKWLANGVQCILKVIRVEGYEHSDLYQLPIKPSPNLPNMAAVYLYPSLCLFEGTMVSVGRGTPKPFQQVGYPNLPGGNIRFTPRPLKGMSENPLYNGEECTGFDLAEFADSFMKYSGRLNLFWMINLYKSAPSKEKFFNSFFLRLAGTNLLKQQLIEGKTEAEIQATWKEGLKRFKETRKKYLLYKDFE
jgi:uncharacterized protein YbbC (DUF1343 family)